MTVFEKDKIILLNLNLHKISYFFNPAHENFPNTGFSAIGSSKGIFINGGIKQFKSLKSSFIFDIKVQQMTKLIDMNENRAFHSSVKVFNNLIYSIGGNNDLSSLTSCEKYNFETGKYEYSAILNFKRESATALCLYNRFIYSIGGWIQAAKRYIENFEKLDIQNEQLGWQIIENKGNDFLTKICINCCEIEEGQFIIFGGQNEKACFSDCFLFNRQEKLINFNSKMEKPATFYPLSIEPIIFNNIAYSMSSKKELHAFNLKTFQWSIIYYFNWVLEPSENT